MQFLLMTKIWLIWLAAILLLFNAFLVTTKLPNGLFTTKEIGLLLGVGSVCLLAAISLLTTKSYKLSIKLLDIAVIAYLILIPLGFLVFDSNNANTPAILTQISYGGSYIALRLLFNSIRAVVLVNMIMEFLAVLLCFQLLIALAQHFSFLPSYYPRFGATGMFFNPGPFAIFITALVVVAWILFLHRLTIKDYLRAAFYGVLITIAICFIIGSLSRSAWLGSLAGLFIGSVWILFAKFKFKITNATVQLSTLVLLLALTPFWYWLYQFKGDSATGRVLTWKVTGLMLKDHWAAGLGTGNFAANYVHYQADFFNQDPENVSKFGNIAGDNRYGFNDILQIFAESGIIGLALFILILVMSGQLLIKLFRQRKEYLLLTGACIAAVLTALLVAGFTAYPLAMLPISILFWFMIAVLASIAPGNEIIISKFPLKSPSVALLLVTGLTFIYFGTTRFNAYRKWLHVTTNKNDKVKTNQLLLLYDQLNTNAEYLNQLAKAHIKAKRYNEAIPHLVRALKFSPYKGYYYTLGSCYEKTGNYQTAMLQYTKVQNAIPNLIKPRYLMAKLHYHKMDYIAFKKTALEVVEFTPKINSAEVIDMKNELSKLLNNPPL